VGKSESRGGLGGGETPRPPARKKSVGVTPLKRKTKEVYQIAFSFQGVECREVVALHHSKANETYCSRLRSEILGRIAKGEFRYDDYFPESSRAALFGHSGKRKTSPLSEFIEEYRTYIKGQVEATTFVSYSKDIDVIKREFGTTLVGGLTRQAIKAWIAREGKSLARVSKLLRHLRAVLSEARDNGVIESSPLDGLNVSRTVPAALKGSQYAPQPYTEAELVTVLANVPEPERYAYQLWAYTGMRTSELIGLRWSRIDTEAGTLRIQEVTVGGLEKANPKTRGSARTLTLLPAAVEAVTRMEALGLKGDRFTTNPRGYGDAKWGVGKLSDAWQRAHSGTGIAPRAPYQLRHTWASNMLSQGANIARIAANLGHRGPAMVLNVYAVWVEQGLAAPGVTFGSQPLWDANPMRIVRETCEPADTLSPPVTEFP
jgi:integrase